jgi:hypothetical protein
MKKIIGTLLLGLITNSVLANVDLNKLTGSYGHYDIVSYTDSLFGPFKMRSLIISYGITDFYLDNGKLMSKDRFCFSEYKANLPTKTSSSDELTQAIIPKPVELEVTEVNGTIKVFRPETPTLLGVDLKSYKESFPSDPKDPRYTDPDKDGKPGVTVNITLGKFFNEEIYIARKEIFSYDMELRKDGSLVGFVRDRSQQYVIDASKKSLVKDSNPPQDPDLRRSPIFLIPVDKTMNCKQLKKDRYKLFPKNPRANKFSRINI